MKAVTVRIKALEKPARARGQGPAGLLGHDGDIEQGPAHGHAAVVGHDRPER